MEKDRKLGGWLLVFLFSTALLACVSLGSMVGAPLCYAAQTHQNGLEILLEYAKGVGFWLRHLLFPLFCVAATVLLLTRRPSGAKVLRRLLVLLAACYTLLGFLMYGSTAFGWYRWLGAFGSVGLDFSRFLITCLACILFSFGWYCYFRRSKRVKAYFSPLETDRLKEQEENGCKR